MISLSILILVVAFLSARIDSEFCFRKIHGPDYTSAGATACRGLIGKGAFTTSRACCESKDGAAYSRQLVTLGKRKRKWRCTPCPSGDDQLIDPFPRDGDGWSSWSDWSQCSVSCSTGTKTRQRLCLDKKMEKCQGESKIVAVCGAEVRDCPVDGGWGPWLDWNRCTKSCGGGITERSRLCNNPPPQYSGKECTGDVVEIQSCKDSPCPVDGGWSEWKSSSICDVSCGKGKLTSIRECSNPAPANGGKNCAGLYRSVERCDTGIKCPVDGGWSLWTSFTDCSSSCGEGKRQRNRECIAPEPRNNGKNCTGESEEIIACYSTFPCPVHGNWSEWSNWGLCLARPCSNQSGVQLRVRTCSNPLPQYRGRHCSGTTTETRSCYYNENCPVGGGWCPWQKYSECRKSNNKEFRMRIRDCNCPVPENGGANCIGNDYEVSRCSTSNAKGEECQFNEGSGDIDDEDSERAGC